MARIAIMQPYLYPYLGYFQLIAAVDRFVFYDDVSFIKNGWINRNRILLDGKPHWWTVPLANASPHRPIRDVMVVDGARWKRKLLGTLEQAYRETPLRHEVLPMVEALLSTDERSIAALATTSVRTVLERLGIGTEIVPSSTVFGNAQLHGQERVVDICRRLGARTYVNMICGRELYDSDAFHAAGIELRFLRPRLPAYPQRAAEFVSALSILDVLMSSSRADAAGMATAHELV